MTRKAITLSTKCAVLLRQAMCAHCGKPLRGPTEYNHILAHALGGSDGPDNLEAVHKVCHAEISNGTKATTAGSTKQVIAKCKRLNGTTGRKRHKRKILSLKFPPRPDGYEYRWPKGRKVGQ